MSPVPSTEYGNLKVQIIRDPQLLQTGSIDFETCRLNKNCLENAVCFPGMHSKYLFRFGSAMFLIFIWNDNADKNTIGDYEKIFTHLFPYTLFNPISNKVELERCTDAFNCHFYFIGLIHGLAGMSISEQCLDRLTGGNNIENMRERFYEFFGNHKINK